MTTSPDPAERQALTTTMPADFDTLPVLRHLIRQMLPPIDDEDASALYFGAVTEIAVNAIQAMDGQAGATIEVTIEIRPRASVRVADTGGGFAESAPEHRPDSAESDSLGQGLAIARNAVPDLTVMSGTDGTVVTLPYPITSWISI